MLDKTTKSCFASETIRINPTTFNKHLIWTSILLIYNCTLTSSFCPPLCSCNDVSLSVDCHEAGNLRLVPIFLNPQTKFLSLAQNQINEIAMSFQFYSELQLLDFSENKIEMIGQNNFENLVNLRVLNGSFNAIQQLDDDVFVGLKNLLILDLSVNQIDKVGTKVLSELKNLRELYLDRNRLESLEWDLFEGLVKLEKLSAKFNFLRIIQPPTSVMSSVGALSGVPEVVRQGESWTLKNVKELDISWNQLTRVKNHGLGMFSSLKWINLCCNYIHTLEENAFVPYFNITSGSGIGIGQQLTFVNLSQNRLGRIPTDSLQKIHSLVELDLSSNGISDAIEPNSFPGLLKLQKLRLSDNPGIISIHPDALIDNINLVDFEADHLSNLTEFQVELFNNKPFLQKFSLQFSQISWLPTELFQNPQYSSLVSTLSLLGSPLDCNCSAYPLFQWIIAQQQGSSASEKIQHNKQPESAVGISNENNNKNDMSQQHLLLPLLLHHHQSLKSQYKSSLAYEQLICVNPPKLSGLQLKDLSSTDFEHCFDHFPLLFASENFEILVIIIASIVIVMILLVVAVKLCCVYQLCAKCRMKLKSKSRSGGGCNGRERNGDNSISVDEFCSNLKPCQYEFPSTAVSPALASKIKKTVHLANNSVNGGCILGGGSGIDNNGLLQLSTLNNTSNRYSNGYCPTTVRNCQNSILRNGQSLSTMTSSGISSASPDCPDYDEDSSSYNNPYTRTQLYPTSYTSSNNKLRFDPKIQLPYSSNTNTSAGETRSHQLFPYHQRSHHSPQPPSAPPPMILHYEYDYPEFPNNNPQKKHHHNNHHNGGSNAAARIKQVPSVLV